MISGMLPSDPRPGPHGGLAEPATARQPAPSSADLELLRQQSIRVLGSVADALEKAAHHRQSLLAEIDVAEQTLLGLVSEREQVTAALTTLQVQLDEAATQLQLAEHQRLRIVREVEQLLSAGLLARAAVQQEVATLERHRDALAAQLARAALAAQPAVQAAETAHAALVARAADMDSAASVALPDAQVAESSMVALRDVEATPAAVTPLATATATRPAAATDGPIPVTDRSSGAKAARADTFAVELTPLRGPSFTPGHADTNTVRLARQHPALSPLLALALECARRWWSTGSGILHTASRGLNALHHPRFPGLGQTLMGLLLVLLFALALLLTPATQVIGGLQLLAVTSGSMEPTVPAGGVVGIRPVAATNLKVGDAITFVSPSDPDVLVTHRIVSLEVRDGQALLTTKGDANDSADPITAPATRAVGRVEFALPLFGYLMVWLSSPIVKIVIVALALFALGMTSIQRSKPPTSPLPTPAPESFGNDQAFVRP